MKSCCEKHHLAKGVVVGKSDFYTSHPKGKKRSPAYNNNTARAMTTSAHKLPLVSPRGVLLVILLAACALSPRSADACGGAVASLNNSSSGSSNNNDKKTKTTTTLLQKTTTSPKATTKSTSTGTGTSSTNTNTTIKKAASTTATAAATKKKNKEKIVTHNVSHVGYLVDLLCWNRPGQRRLPIHPLSPQVKALHVNDCFYLSSPQVKALLHVNDWFNLSSCATSANTSATFMLLYVRG